MPTKLTSDDSDTASDSLRTEEEDGAEDEAEYTDDSSSEEETTSSEHPYIVWTGYGKKIPVLIFKADSVVHKKQELKAIGERYHLAFKLVKTECKLIRSLLLSHGFHEAHPNSNDFNLMWTGSHLKPYTLRSLQEFQKVNHFPRSYEITRKDRLYKNVQRMQQTKGFKHFDILPQSFIVPGEYQDFCSAFLKEKGSWIVKPIASSRGRGIMLVNHPEQVPLDDTMIVSRYLHNPLLIDGFKFDLRIYVAVTSYDPLLIYLYEEGLTRFATVKYEKHARNIRNQCMHLTNYSVNKKSNDYVQNDDPDVEDYGNKWSLGALLRYLRSQGKDTTALMMRIEDVIIKTLLSAELAIATACKMFMPSRGNCFEVYGFDILIDDTLRPWVLEVNLSPSLACDSPLDLKIKSNMMADLFSLVGFICHDPILRKMQQSKRNYESLAKIAPRSQSAQYRPMSALSRRYKRILRSRPMSASSTTKKSKLPKSQMSGLSGEEIRIVRRAKEEYARRGGWVRIFPSQDSWELYGSFLQYNSNNNFMLYQNLYPEKAKTMPGKPTTASYSSSLARTKSLHLQTQLPVSGQVDDSLANAIQRSLQYERKLSSLGAGARRRRAQSGSQRKTGGPSTSGACRGVLIQGIESDKTVQSYDKPPSEDLDKAESEINEGPSPARVYEVPSSTKSLTSSGRDYRPKEKVEQLRVEPTAKPSKQILVVASEKPKYNVVELLEKGRVMSKVQARHAFATYLLRVQLRLMQETNSSDCDDSDTANEQMDLVLRFLKRAAGNLQQPFKVVVPSRKLPINDRRRILAKQLGDFVHIYNKETDLLRQRNNLDKKHLRRPPSFTKHEGLDEMKFNNFVSSACEADLEEVLTTYTKLNKSASIFLGSNSKSSPDYKAPSVTSSSSQTETGLSRRKEESSDLTLVSPSKNQDDRAEPIGSAQNYAKDSSSALAPSGSIAAAAAAKPFSSYASAVSIYSTKLTTNPPPAKQRPVSANQMRSGGVHGHRSRPMSAHARTISSSHRERPDGADDNMKENYDEDAINAALERLKLRQQQRNYTAKPIEGDNTKTKERTPSISSVIDISTNNRHQERVTSNTERYPASLPRTNETNQTDHDISREKKRSRSVKDIEFKFDSSVGSGDGRPHSMHGMRSRPTNSNSAATSTGTLGATGSNAKYNSLTSANDTFNSFINDSVGSFDNDLVVAYNQVTGTTPINNNYTPTQNSKQMQIAQQHKFAKQQSMLEQSKALLEISKAKHQAMVAQAHAAQKSKQTSYESSSPPGAVHAPKPPASPATGKKPYRQPRVTRNGSGSEEMIYNPTTSYNSYASPDFYSSLKYDVHTGTAKSMYGGNGGHDQSKR